MYRSKLIWSVVGLATPLLAAALFIPVLLDRIGPERFGVVALAWALLSSASALDMGIGRATTQYLAALRGRQTPHDIPLTIQVAWRLSLTYSIAGALLCLLAVAFETQSLIRHQSISDTELRNASLIVIAVLPIQVLTALYRGISEAFEDFRATSLVRLYLGVANFAAPVLISVYTHSLVALMASLLLGRLIGLLLQYRFARRAAHASVNPPRPGTDPASEHHTRREIRRQLNRFGKWMTVSNIAHPLLMQSDRFIIASIVSASAVTAYYIPFEVVIQSTMVASAVTSVMFPMLTARLQSDADAGHSVFRIWRNRLLLLAAALYLMLSQVFPMLLHYWMGDKVSSESAQLGQILCLGAFFYTLSVIYTSYLHAQGRVRACATLQLIELALYLPALYLSTQQYGLKGAAWCWVGRSIVDALALACISSWRAHRSGSCTRA